MLYIKDMNLVEILILSQSETKARFNGSYYKGESEGVCIKCALQSEAARRRGMEKSRSLNIIKEKKSADVAAQSCSCP